MRAVRQLLELARDAESKQASPESQNSMLGDLDREVVDGILKRFKGVDEVSQIVREVDDDDNQRA